MIIRSDIESCKAKLQSMIGTRVKLISNGGRKRLIVYDGVVDNCYPNHFTVKCMRESDGKFEIVSYNYVDVLTRAVRISIPASGAQTAAS